MVADDERDVDVELTGLVAREQGVEAVRGLRDEERQPRAVLREVELLLEGVEGPDEVRHGGGEGVPWDEEVAQIPGHAHEEDGVLAGVHVLVEGDDVAAVAVDEVGDLGDQAGPVRAREEQDGVVAHEARGA